MRLWIIAIWKTLPRSWVIVLLPFVLLVSVFGGWYLFGGLFIKPPNLSEIHYTDELERLLPKAEKGDKQAQYQVGVIYRDGLAGTKNINLSARWFEKAVKLGHPPAQYALGRAYALGEGVVQNFGRAAELYQKAAVFARHAASEFALGQLYFQGKGVLQDYKQALTWYQKAALRNHAGAQAVMGSMYAKGFGIDQNFTEAYVWYSLAAAQPKKTARFGLALNLTEALADAKAKLNRLDLKQGNQKLKSIRKKLKLK
jgi:TPR repeat protein